MRSAGAFTNPIDVLRFVNRRTVLRGAGAIASGVAVAGCTDDGTTDEGLPDLLAFVAEFPGERPGDVARAEVTEVRGLVGSGLEDWQDAGTVEVSGVEATAGADGRSVTVSGAVTNASDDALEEVQVFANLWLAEDRVVATATDDTDRIDAGAAWAFEADYQFSPDSGHLVPIVAEEIEATVPYVTGPTPFEL